MRYARTGWLGGIALILAATTLPARADDKAEALLQQTRAATAKLRTLRADVEFTVKGRFGSSTSTGMVALKRPNLARFETTGDPSRLVVADGKNFFRASPGRDLYQKTELAADGRNLAIPLRPFGEPVLGFFSPDIIGRGRSGSAWRYIGRERLDGDECEIVELNTQTPEGAPGPRKFTLRYFISDRDHLIHQTVTTFVDEAGTTTNVSRLKNVQTDAPIDDATFRWTPPATALLVPPTLADFEKKLVPVGQPAPDFNLPMPQGGQLSLSDARKGKKATLVNFWFYG
jgi:outer membrane lipoprotein-sorting protein